jgi:hypothetical protein
MTIREITSDMAQQQNVEELWAGPAKLTVLRQLEMGRDSHIPTIKAALPALNSFFMRQGKPNRTGAEPQTGGCRIQTLKTSALLHHAGQKRISQGGVVQSFPAHRGAWEPNSRTASLGVPKR